MEMAAQNATYTSELQHHQLQDVSDFKQWKDTEIQRVAAPQVKSSTRKVCYRCNGYQEAV